MSATPTISRRLLRTKEAAVYLSISQWKLRRLIEEDIIPVAYPLDQESGSLKHLLGFNELQHQIFGRIWCEC